MAWFKPARNRDHPGDPAPKWTPLSRAGRIVLLVTVIVSIVVALMMVATRTAGAADSTDGQTLGSDASAPPWFGGRIEMREHGFAVTWPDDWVGLDMAADETTQLRWGSGSPRA